MAVLGAVLVLATCLALFLLCLKFRHLCTYFLSWLPSNREEKAALTRLKGHYNANGYLVGSDSDIRLDWTGSFRRFESVDSEGALGGATAPSPIPPQPLRPAPDIVGTHSSPPPLTSLTQPTSHDVEAPDPSEGVPVLGRAISCDSVSSVTSIAAQDLVEPNIAGYLCIGIDYDCECGDLMVNVIEAKDLVCRDFPVSPDGLMDTFVSVYLLPTRTTDMQTRTYRSSRSPSYKEKFLFGLEVTDFCRSSVMFQVYGAKREGNSLLGQANLHLADVPTRQPITTWLTLYHTETRENALGEILFSLSYLPTAERLTVVIIRARNLKFSQATADPYVKVYLLKNGKKVHKKRTQTKKNDASPIFNEAMMFNVPNSLLQSVELRVTVGENDTGEVVGHVIVGCHVGGKALSHWSQMIASLRKPVAMWHPLLRPSIPLMSPTRPRPTFTAQR